MILLQNQGLLDGQASDFPKQLTVINGRTRVRTGAEPYLVWTSNRFRLSSSPTGAIAIRADGRRIRQP